MVRVLVLLLLALWGNPASAVTFCRDPPPGIDAMSRGVDITKVDLLPLDTTTANGFGRRLIAFTCEEGKTWQSPYEPGRIYNLPDQVETINALPGGVLDATYNVYRDYRNVKKSAAGKLGVELLNGMFSASGSYSRAHNSISNSSKTVTTVEAHFSGVEVDFAPHWEQTLIRSAQTFVERRLPNTFEANPGRFADFIRRYGTHFFDTGKFGGVFKVTVEMEESLHYRFSESQLEANAKGSFFKLLKANGGYQGTNTEVSEEFSSRSHITSRFFGGNANLLAAGSWATWWPTVPANPWLFGGHLERITEMLEDGPKKAALEKAVTIYLDKAYLREIQRTMASFVGRGKVGEARVSPWVAQAASLLEQQVPDHAAVTALGASVDEFLLVPNWFSQHTQLCYHWYPDGDAGQCSGPSRTICALVDKMTAEYRDDTDRRGGGCRMRWGITSVPGTAPAWFLSGVKVCYRWHADGDGGQCGGGAPAETCAPVGDATAWYRDDTDRRGGGCQMSWRLQVPADVAPGWLLNSRLCFSWRPDGDGGQCGGGADRDLCARANDWTPYYRDDTDRRGGGCLMSWGIKV